MSDLLKLLSSTTNRLVLLCLVACWLSHGLFENAYSGFELFPLANPQFQTWQLLTSVFLHASLTHLAFNMIALWSFGQVLERVWGGRRFLIFFLLCGVGAGAISLLINDFNLTRGLDELRALGASDFDINQLLTEGRIRSDLASAVTRDSLSSLVYLYNAPMVGASGAIYGLLVAFALLFPNFKLMLIFLPVPIAAKVFVPILLLIDLVGGFTGFSIFGAHIAHFAHLGGALIGLIIVLLWMRQHPQA